MSSILSIPFNGGYVSTGTGARDASTLDTGELVTMQSAYYRKNDPTQVWKMGGRTLFGSAGSTIVKGLAICQFDSGGTDKLVVSIGTTLVAATPGATGTFASLATGLNASATTLTACHQNDHWYLGNGYDINKCLKSDGTTRDMGLQAPQSAMTAVVSATSGGSAYPTANSGSFTNPTFAYDGVDNTFAGGTLGAAGSVTHTWTTWVADATSERSLVVKWALAGFFPPDPTHGTGASGGVIGTGGTVDSGFLVTVLFEKSEDAGVTWSTLTSSTRKKPSAAVGTSEFTVTATSSSIQFRATLTYTDGTNKATLAIYDVSIKYGSTAAVLTAPSIYYAYTESILAEGLESPPSPTTFVGITAQNTVTFTRPAKTNSAATHWYIYRGVDGGVNYFDNLGLLGKEIPIAQTTYVDRFTTDKDTQLTQLIPTLVIGDLPIPRDEPPPAFSHMMSWNGSICGISRTERRTWRYSEAGFAESFPAFYVVSSFPLDEHDGLVGQMAVGETAVLLCEGAALAIDETPRVVDGEFKGANARPLKGHPGCVGIYAFTAYSVSGEPRGAWVSPYGVYITNGQQCDCISTDLAWESEVNVPYLGTSVLRWDAKNLILWFEFDYNGDGLNDREMPFHMAPHHQKGENKPKLGQPTAKATSCMASALIASTHYRFSGHPSNGGVYVEESGTDDAATGSAVAMAVKTGQVSHQKVDLAIVKVTLNHSDFGTGETGTLTTTLYRDMANSSNSREQPIRLDGNRGTTIGCGRAGELVDFELEYSGDGVGGISGIDAEVDGQGRSGSAARWVSSSATP